MVLLILGLCFLFLTFTQKMGQQTEWRLFVLLNGKKKRPLWLDRLMLSLTQLGNGLFAGLLSALFFQQRRLLSAQILLGSVGLWMVVKQIKQLVGRKRPYAATQSIRLVGLQEPGGSFPSGHTAQSFFLASLLSAYFTLSTLWSCLLFLLASVVGMTRIYVGAHYPKDVAGGAILGTAWAFLLSSIYSAPIFLC